MVGNEEFVVGKLEYLRNEVIPFFQDNFGVFNQMLAEYTNLSVKFLNRPDFSMFQTLLNSCRSNHCELEFLLGQVQLKSEGISIENQGKVEEKSRVLSSLAHLDTKILSLKNELNMVDEDKLSYLAEIQNEKSEKMKMMNYLKTQKKKLGDLRRSIRALENDKAEYFENFSILKQYEKNYNKEILEIDIKNCVLRKKIHENFEKAEEGKKELGRLKREYARIQAENFELEQNIKYLGKMIDAEDKGVEEASRELERSFDRIADTALMIKKMNLSHCQETVKSLEDLCDEAEIRVLDSLAISIKSIKDYKIRIFDQMHNIYKVRKALSTWADFTELTKYAETVALEKRTWLEEQKALELNNIEEQKRKIDSCFNKNKRNQRKSSVKSRKNSEIQSKSTQILQNPAPQSEPAKIPEPQFKSNQIPQHPELQLKPNQGKKTPGYSNKCSIDTTSYKDNFTNEYFH